MSHRLHAVAQRLEILSRIESALAIAILSLCITGGCSEVASTGPTAPPAAQARNAALPPPIQTAPAIEPAPAAHPATVAPTESVPDAEPAASVESSDPAKPRRIIGQTTRDVRDAAKEEAKGAKRVQPKITGQDPITVSGNAYSVIVGRTEQLQIKHSLDLYYNLNERYPKDLQEFMKEIIKANGIRLAQLPFYQEYGYDAVKHELVILEYPDKKAQLPGGGK